MQGKGAVLVGIEILEPLVWKVMWQFLKTKTVIPYDVPLPVLRIFLRNLSQFTTKENCIFMLTVARPTVVRSQNQIDQTRCSSGDK